MRKSFILHLDSLCILDDLTDEQRGQLFNAIYKFNAGEEIALTGMLKIAFSPFKNQFMRDIVKYDVFCESQRKRRLGKGRNQAEPNKPKEPTVTKLTNGTNSVSVNDSDSNNISDESPESDFELFWNSYNKKKDRKKCETAWKNLTKKNKEYALASVEGYVQSTPEVKYRKNPLTWLHGESWNDEVAEDIITPEEDYKRIGKSFTYQDFVKKHGEDVAMQMIL